MSFRVGIGWDRHPLAPGHTCILGGVHFDTSPVGPVGHSDGDAVCHAFGDALLGAAGLGDIGQHFPDTDPQWAGADSLELLGRMVDMVQGAGYRVGNADCTVITEQPRIAPRAADMRDRLAPVLGIDSRDVSIKATRGEGVGPEGRQECITVVAVVMIETTSYRRNRR